MPFSADQSKCTCQKFLPHWILALHRWIHPNKPIRINMGNESNLKSPQATSILSEKQTLILSLLSRTKPARRPRPPRIRHAHQALNRHQKRAQRHDAADRERNVRIPLKLLHKVEQSDLAHKRRHEAQRQAYRRVLVLHQPEHHERRRGRERREQYHASARRAGYLGMHAHREHERPLHDASPHAEHASEESRCGAHHGIHDRGARVPSYVALDVRVSGTFLDVAPSHEVGSCEYAHE
mmetsp:Transcript_35852/g.86547  ORF Transcript_35852/g.86547 Transcript_35852/m.86547 type:complete len:238 (+) Transcript_35852:46-759(+)